MGSQAGWQFRFPHPQWQESLGYSLIFGRYNQKLGLSFYHYIYDRVSQASNISALAELITQQAQQYPLGES